LKNPYSGIAKMCVAKLSIGIEIKIEKLTGKLKASQNQPAPNRAGVKAGLAGEENPDSKK
jgi:transcriptional regulator